MARSYSGALRESVSFGENLVSRLISLVRNPAVMWRA